MHRQDQFTISSPGVKLLVYKDCKKNVHRVKLRTDRKNLGTNTNNNNNANTENALDLSVDVDDQFLKDNLNTMEKMHQLRTQLELKKRDKGSKLFNKMGTKTAMATADGKNPIHFKFRDDNAAGNNDEVGAVGGIATATAGATAIGSPCKLEVNTSKTPRKFTRRIYIPPLKGFIENATSLKKNSRTDTDSLALTDSNVLSKHQTQLPNPINKSIPNDTNPSSLSSSSTSIRSDDSIWPAKVINEIPKSKRKLNKSNWIQNLIEIMKTSKVPLSPGELIEIKESFESIKESLGKDRPNSPSSSDKMSADKQSPFETMLSNFNKATTITSESYRSKIRDNIRRNRSFKAVGSNDLIMEENRVGFFSNDFFKSIFFTCLIAEIEPILFPNIQHFPSILYGNFSIFRRKSICFFHLT